MKKWFCFGLIIFFVTHTVFACAVVDDEGRVVKLNQPAQRIISLAPDLTELLFAAGAGTKIIGVMRGSNYPVAATKITWVASYNQLDAEKIVALHPDLIVVWSAGGLAAAVKKLGVPVYFSNQHKLTDIPVTLRRLGCLAGSQSLADQAAADFMRHYAQLKKRYARKNKIKVFYQVWPQPLLTVNHTSWINDVIQVCGGANIFADLTGAAPEVDVEAVLQKNPDVIIASAEQKNWQAQWQRWPQINAIKQQHLVTVDADLLERAGPRILIGMEQVCRAICKNKVEITRNAHV